MGEEFLITVITVVFNAEKEIEKTIDSVLNQDFSPFEYVIVDGGSTDNTNAIIKKKIDECPNGNVSIRYISEKDNGIYDAMNKAVKMSKGKYLLHINNGDVLFSNHTLQEAAGGITKHLDKNFIYGDVINELNGWYKIRQDIDLSHITDYMSISHQSIFIRRSELLLHPYNEEYRICADYYFVLERFLNAGKNEFQYIPVMIAVSGYGGVSSTCVNETTTETLDLKRRLGVLSEQEYEIEMGKLHAGNKKEPLKTLIRKIVPYRLRKINGDKKREERGWKKSIAEVCCREEVFDENNYN